MQNNDDYQDDFVDENSPEYLAWLEKELLKAVSEPPTNHGKKAILALFEDDEDDDDDWNEQDQIDEDSPGYKAFMYLMIKDALNTPLIYSEEALMKLLDD